MPRAVRFDHYGGLEVLQVVEVPGRSRVRERSWSGSKRPALIRVRPRSGKD